MAYTSVAHCKRCKERPKSPKNTEGLCGVCGREDVVNLIKFQKEQAKLREELGKPVEDRKVTKKKKKKNKWR